MKLKQTLIFALFVFGVVGYTIYDYSKVKFNDKSKTESVKLFPYFKRENLKEFKITDNEKIIFLKKTNAVWQLLAPIEYPADQEYIQGLVSLLDEPIEEISSLDDPDIFSKATVNIGFKYKGGEYKDLLVSYKKTNDGKVYIQDIKTKKMYTTNADWLAVSKKSIYDFRWKYLFVLKENIKNIKFVKNSNKEYSFTYDKPNNIWRSPVNSELVFSDKKIAQFLSELMSIKVYRFVSEIKNPSVLKNYSLTKPSIKVTFNFANEKLQPWGLHISKETKGVFYATFDNRDQIFELKKDDVNKLKTYLNELN